MKTEGKLFDSLVRWNFLKPETKGLMIIEPKTKGFNAFAWVKNNENSLKDCLRKFGGILLRGFDIYAVSEFNKIVQILYPNLLEYVYRSTPRTKLGGKIYTATEYPANRVIPIHNENSYSKKWPKIIFFFSVIVPLEGGETPIADSRKIYQKIDQSIREKFESKGLNYVRNYNVGIDLSWQEVFQTDNKEEVNQYCKDNGIDYEWKNCGGTELKTTEFCQASIIHPVTGEPVWFNQAHLFHISALKENDKFDFIREVGEENLPRNVFYGDGSPIENESLEHIRRIYEEEKIKFKWRKGDIMILDNILMAHGRETYLGERKIAVAMTEDS